MAMNRIVITEIEYHNRSYTAYIVLDDARRFVELQVFEPEDESLPGRIYVGYVEKLVPNINAAFVRIGDGRKCYLPLADVKSPLYAKKQSKTKPLCEGDEILVQVVKDAVKTKDAVVSTKLTLHGLYCFLTTENTRLAVSKKLGGERSVELAKLMENTLSGHSEKGYGLVLRTNAAERTDEELRRDMLEVAAQFEHLRTNGIHRRQGELVYRSMPGYLARLKGQAMQEIDIVYTDRQELYDEITALLPDLRERGILRLYQDDAVSLSTLYSIKSNMDNLLAGKVWLDSGANIIIESLETLTVIDVNSSKNCSRRDKALFSVNVEAAREIARQLRLRNISGMIIVDFINMESEEQKKELVSVLKQELKKDHVPANFIDITKLGLVEITRKKVYKSLREILM